MPQALKPLGPALQAALLAGLFEGGLVAGHRFLSVEGPLQRPVDVLADVATVAGLHLVALLLLGLGLLILTRDPFSLLRGVLSLWAVEAFVARRLVEDQAGPGAHPLLLVVLLGLWLVPRRFRESLRPVYRLVLAAAAVLTISVYSLWGRAPDFRHDLGTLGWLYLASAVVALGVTLAFSRWPRATAAAAAVLAAVVVTGTGMARSVPEDRPSVLFVLVDTTRRDHVSPFDDLVQTPAIDRLASRGVLFSDAVTVIPKTPQSVASFFTARYPARHGLRGLYDDLSPTQPSVVRAFQEAGYPTTALVNNPWLSAARGFGQGFDRFHETDAVREDFGSAVDLVTWGILFERGIGRRLDWRPPPLEGHFKARAVDLTNAAVQVLRRQQEPFFLYVHYFQPHWPYQPPPELQERYDAPPPETSPVNSTEKSGISRGRLIFHNDLTDEQNEGARRLYRGEMDGTMAEVGRLLAALEGSPFGDNTIVVFTADHGHALGEHDYYFHHGAFLYDASVRIPLILSWPGHLPEGRVVEHLVRSIDVAPTLLDLAGVKLTASLDGRSLVGSWSGGDTASRGALLESDVRMMDANERREVDGVLGKLRAWRSGPYKLILTPAPEGPRFELFNLVEDPLEERDLSEDEAHRETLAALQEALADALPVDERRVFLPIEPGSEEASSDGESGVSESDLELLRQLGYVE